MKGRDRLRIQMPRMKPGSKDLLCKLSKMKKKKKGSTGVLCGLVKLFRRLNGGRWSTEFKVVVQALSRATSWRTKL